VPQKVSSLSRAVAAASKSPPPHVRLGPRTRRLLSGAHWQGMDAFPACQIWADDVELILTFLEGEGRSETFLSTVQSVRTPQHRDARLAEARGAFYLSRNGFRVVEWEPPGEGLTRGEVMVSLPGAPHVFVEVKQPGWQGEQRPRRIAELRGLSPELRERCFARMKEEKYIGMEGGPVGSHIRAMDVVRRNALPKLTDRCPNLAVVVDDLKVTPVGLPSLPEFVVREFSKPDHDPDDPDDVYTYERLGGILFLQPEANNDERIDYRADFVENPGVLPACSLPPSVSAVLSQLRHESRQRIERRYAGQPSLFDILKRKR
jgi:hypothetical protein